MYNVSEMFQHPKTVSYIISKWIKWFMCDCVKAALCCNSAETAAGNAELIGSLRHPSTSYIQRDGLQAHFLRVLTLAFITWRISYLEICVMWCQLWLKCMFCDITSSVWSAWSLHKTCSNTTCTHLTLVHPPIRFFLPQFCLLPTVLQLTNGPD